MYRVGLTGGIASGKSTVSRVLSERGAVVIEADVVARSLVEPGSPLLAELTAEFGDGVLQNDGALDRAALGRIAFASEERLARLNEITHPPLVARLITLVEDAERDSAGTGGVLVVDAALLVEWDILDLFDTVVVVDAPIEVRIERLVANGLTEDRARERMAAQLPSEELAQRGDIVIDNSGTLDDLRRAANQLALRLLNESERGLDTEGPDPLGELFGRLIRLVPDFDND